MGDYDEDDWTPPGPRPIGKPMIGLPKDTFDALVEALKIARRFVADVAETKTTSVGMATTALDRIEAALAKAGRG